MNPIAQCLTAVTLLLTGSACSELRFKQAVPLKVTAEAQPSDEPNKYNVKLSWNKISDAFYIYRLTDGKEVLLTHVQESNKSFVDSKIPGGTEVIYVLKSKTADQKLRIKLPQDLVVNEKPLTFTGFKDGAVVATFSRLFLKNPFYTNGFSGTLQFKEIIVQGGKIESFPEGQTAEMNMEGRSGGELKITAEKLTGDLAIVLRGENGGQGLKGVKGSVGGKGLKGKTVSTGELATAYCTPEQIAARKKESNRWAEYHPGRGGMGEVGGRGGPGYPGKRGGHSGTIEVQILNLDKQRVLINLVPGEAGIGGEGGDGGDGGAGGDGGEILSNRACEASPSGQVGDPGERGLQGPDGEKGELGRAIVNGEVLQ